MREIPIEQRTIPQSLMGPMNTIVKMIAGLLATKVPGMPISQDCSMGMADTIIRALVAAYDAGVADGKEKAT